MDFEQRGIGKVRCKSSSRPVIRRDNVQVVHTVLFEVQRSFLDRNQAAEISRSALRIGCNLENVCGTRSGVQELVAHLRPQILIRHQDVADGIANSGVLVDIEVRGHNLRFFVHVVNLDGPIGRIRSDAIRHSDLELIDAILFVIEFGVLGHDKLDFPVGHFLDFKRETGTRRNHDVKSQFVLQVLVFCPNRPDKNSRRRVLIYVEVERPVLEIRGIVLVSHHNGQRGRSGKVLLVVEEVLRRTVILHRHHDLERMAGIGLTQHAIFRHQDHALVVNGRNAEQSSYLDLVRAVSHVVNIAHRISQFRCRSDLGILVLRRKHPNRVIFAVLLVNTGGIARLVEGRSFVDVLDADGQVRRIAQATIIRYNNAHLIERVHRFVIQRLVRLDVGAVLVRNRDQRKRQRRMPVSSFHGELERMVLVRIGHLVTGHECT